MPHGTALQAPGQRPDAPATPADTAGDTAGDSDTAGAETSAVGTPIVETIWSTRSDTTSKTWHVDRDCQAIVERVGNVAAQVLRVLQPTSHLDGVQAAVELSVGDQRLADRILNRWNAGTLPDDDVVFHELYQEVRLRDGVCWETTDYRLCRMCAFEPVAVRVLQADDDEPVRFVTASAATPPPKTVAARRRAVTKPVSDRSLQRLDAIAAATALRTVSVGSVHERVLAGPAPVRALQFLHRNLWTCVPDQALTADGDMADGVVAVFWTTMHTLQEPGAPAEETWWTALAAAHA